MKSSLRLLSLAVASTALMLGPGQAIAGGDWWDDECDENNDYGRWSDTRGRRGMDRFDRFDRYDRYDRFDRFDRGRRDRERFERERERVRDRGYRDVRLCVDTYDRELRVEFRGYSADRRYYDDVKVAAFLTGYSSCQCASSGELDDRYLDEYSCDYQDIYQTSYGYETTFDLDLLAGDFCGGDAFVGIELDEIVVVIDRFEFSFGLDDIEACDSSFDDAQWP